LAVPAPRAPRLRPRLPRPALRRARAPPAGAGALRSPAARRGRPARARELLARRGAGGRRARDDELAPLRRRAHYALPALMVTAICPGSYDPVTNGHVDVIRRAAAIFDRVVVGVVRDPHHKSTMFTVDERVEF